jgi:hypothetical protein
LTWRSVAVVRWFARACMSECELLESFVLSFWLTSAGGAGTFENIATPHLAVMPELHLLDFRHRFLTGIAFCSTVDIQPGDEHQELPREGYAWYDAVAAEQRALFLVQFNICEGTDTHPRHYHLHFNLDLEDYAAELSDFREAQLDELKAGVLPLFGRMASVGVIGHFSIPLSELPKRGMIQALLGVEAPAASWKLNLSGARFMVEGDTFTEVSWDVDDDWECINGKIEGFLQIEIGDETLTHIADLLEKGINQLLVERPEGEKSHGEKSASVRRRVAE